MLKTKIVLGAEIPEIHFIPKLGEKYATPYVNNECHKIRVWSDMPMDKSALQADACYRADEEGIAAAVAHAKAWLSYRDANKRKR